jgi:hypothetical protein
MSRHKARLRSGAKGRLDGKNSAEVDALLKSLAMGRDETLALGRIEADQGGKHFRVVSVGLAPKNLGAKGNMALADRLAQLCKPLKGGADVKMWPLVIFHIPSSEILAIIEPSQVPLFVERGLKSPPDFDDGDELFEAPEPEVDVGEL